MSIVPGIVPPQPITLHHMRRFLVTFNNAKKHGKYPVKTHTAEGCQFTGGHVVIDTEEFQQKGFLNIVEMEDAMSVYGNVTIDYID